MAQRTHSTGSYLARVSVQRAVTAVVTYLLVGGGAVLVLIPFAWMLSTALKLPDQVYVYPPVWIPEPIVFPQHFVDALQRMLFVNSLRNTLFYAIGSSLGLTATSSLVAFGFARMRWPGRNAVFLLVIATMMLPGQVTLVPTFVLFSKLNWVNTFKPLMVPPWFGGAWQVFMLRQFFMTLPLDLDESARIDGCSTWGVLWRIILPLSKPALITIALLAFTFYWNEFMGPLVYLNGEEKMVLSIALREMQGQYHVAINALMAGTLMTIMPLIILFYCFQRVFIQGIVFTGIKG